MCRHFGEQEPLYFTALTPAAGGVSRRRAPRRVAAGRKQPKLTEPGALKGAQSIRHDSCYTMCSE